MDAGCGDWIFGVIVVGAAWAFEGGFWVCRKLKGQ